MLDRADLDLNLVPNSSNSLMEALKQTMLNQEVLFKSQVFELQQLHKMQTATLERFKLKGSDNYNLYEGVINPIPINLNYPLKSSMKPLDLQLSADEFISLCADDISAKGVVTGCLNEPSFALNSSLDIPNLSLSIGRDASKMVEEKGSWKGKKCFTSSFGSTDIDNDNLSFSKYEEYRGLASISSASNSFSRYKHKLDSFLDKAKQKFESNSQIGIGSSYGSTLNRSIGDSGLSYQPELRYNSGINQHPGSFLPAYRSSENQMSLNSKMNDLDLNKVQLEDLSYISNDHSMVVNVTSSASPTSWRPLTETHNIQRKDVNFKDFGEKFSKEGKFSGADIIYIDLDLDSSEDQCSETFVPKISNMGPPSKISNGLSCRIDLNDAIGAESNLGKASRLSSESECMTDHNSSCIKTMQSAVGSDAINFSTSDERDKIKVPALAVRSGLSCRIDLNDAVGAESNLGKVAELSSESDCMTDHNSSSIKTMQSAVGSDDINFSTSDEREKIKVPALAVRSGEQDVRSPDSTESNTQCIIRKESEEIDGSVETMAELLVLMSSEPQTCRQSVISNIPSEEFQKKEADRPQHSLDSYEAMVLKTEEMSLDDYCVSSNAFLVDETEKKDITFKLKRGTRMRDFQKDILPSLSTLSRNEIREDVNILQGVIKSREYKRMRAKMADGGGDLCGSTKSKRSRRSRK